MEKFKEFLGLRNVGEYLAGEHQSSLNEIFSFISWPALLVIVFWSLRWLPPFRNFVLSIRNDLYSEFSESELVRDLIPNFQHRCHYYKILLKVMLLTMLVGYALSFYYGSYALATLANTNIKINKLNAFFILISLSTAMFFVGYYFMKEANKLRNFLQRIIF